MRFLFVFSQLHMGTMFSSMADLSGLLAEDDHKNLYVSKVIHKAFIEVDEEGSESSGSSGKLSENTLFILCYVSIGGIYLAT